jgi:citrate lyase subunit beta/citryl-CoA lyase
MSESGMPSWCDGVCFLFAPADRPERFAKAAVAGADGMIIDLEASVHPQRKDTARDHAQRWLAARGNVVSLVRINGVTTPWFARDAAMLRAARVDGVLLPMVDDAADVARARTALGDAIPLLPMIETAAGVDDARAIARSAGVVRLAFGNMDYQTQIGTTSDAAMIYPSSRIVVASRAAGLPPPLAGVTAAFRDLGRLDADVRFERSLGFGGKLCIHPDQIAPILDAFLPDAALVAWAERVLAASADSFAAEVDGQLVDRPVVERAQRVLARARRR